MDCIHNIIFALNIFLSRVLCILFELFCKFCIALGFRCNCGNCSTELIVKPEECQCCHEIAQVRNKMMEEKMGDQCLTKHPGFEAGCLNQWALRLADLSYKTKNKGCKNDTTLYKKGKKTEAE